MSGAAPAAVRPPGCIVGVFSETEKRLTTSSLQSLPLSDMTPRDTSRSWATSQKQKYFPR